MNGKVMDCEIFRCPQVKESPRQYLLPNRYFTENSRWVPLFNFIGLRLTQGIKVDFIYVFMYLLLFFQPILRALTLEKCSAMEKRKYNYR